jgi:hypothetical protein
MNSPSNPNYSYGDPNVQNSFTVNPQEQSNSRVNKSFVDNKPMIQGLVRSVLKVEKNGEAHLINTGLTDIEGAKQIAQNIFGFYDKDRSGNIDQVKVNLKLYRPCQSWPTPTESLTPVIIHRKKMLILSLKL